MSESYRRVTYFTRGQSNKYKRGCITRRREQFDYVWTGSTSRGPEVIGLDELDAPRNGKIPVRYFQTSESNKTKGSYFTNVQGLKNGIYSSQRINGRNWEGANVQNGRLSMGPYIT